MIEIERSMFFPPEERLTDVLASDVLADILEARQEEGSVNHLVGWGYPSEHGHWAIDGVQYTVRAWEVWQKRGFWKRVRPKWKAQAWPLVGDVGSLETGEWPSTSEALCALERMVKERHNE
jgi:hypothetical protein